MNIEDIFRKATRPIVTIIFAAVLAQVVVEGIDAPEWFIALAIPVILWWFGERTVKHIKDKPSSPSEGVGEGLVPSRSGEVYPRLKGDGK